MSGAGLFSVPLAIIPTDIAKVMFLLDKIRTFSLYKGNLTAALFR